MQGSLDASLVRIRSTDGRVVGAGFLVGERQILTCAHVVSQTPSLSNTPLETPQGIVSLDFPLISPHSLYCARVVLWHLPLSDGRGDIAGLELQGEPPAAAEVVCFAEASDVWEHPFRAFGFPAGYDDGVWATGRLLGRQATDWIMIEDVKAQGFGVAPGFSGTPVWDTHLQGVVGMVVAASRPADIKAAFVLPMDVLMAAWPLIEPVTRSRVFLSAAPADTVFAGRLATDLRAHDIIVWTEQQTPGVGHAGQEERVRQAIRTAQAVVLVVSSQTRSSRTVKEHLHLADMYQRRLILMWAGDEEHREIPSHAWADTFWVDAREPHYVAALDEVEAALSKHRSISALLKPYISITEPLGDPRNPYKGLRSFTADDAGDFFGRAQLVNELIQEVGNLLAPALAGGTGSRLLAIIGPSGSGKSSVVMAGLLQELQHKVALSGSKEWVYLEPMLPGEHPMEALTLTLAAHFPAVDLKRIRENLEDDATRGLHLLTTALTKRPGKRPETKVVLLIDQFEELFTQVTSEEERRRFIDLLVTAVTEPRGSFIVLLTLRADYYDRLLNYSELYRLVETHHKPILPMEEHELWEVIEKPAALPDVQLTFEGNLVGDLVFGVWGQAGALPLLEFTLEQLFERRSGHRLTLSAYREIGGVKGALSQHAEKTYTALPTEDHRRLARILFLRLIDLGTTEQDVTRRRAALSELSLADTTTTRLLRETADAFIEARLLTTNEVAGSTTIEVSHEAVIREWRRFADLIREAHEDLHLLRVIREDAAAWRRYGSSSDRLYRGTQLAEALAWRERSLLSLDEEAFLEASVNEQERQEGLIAEREQQEALQRKRYTRRIVLVGLAGGGLTLAALGVSVFLLRSKQGHTAAVESVDWSPDGKRLASASDDRTVRIWDATSGHLLLIYKGHTGAVWSVAWSSDGKRLASGGDDNTVQVWDASSGQLLFTN